MALVREYEVPSTGLVAPNAYHVIKKVTTEKRLHDVANVHIRIPTVHTVGTSRLKAAPAPIHGRRPVGFLTDWKAGR